MSNRYTEASRRQQILAFVRANPGCTSRMVGEAFGIESRRAGAELDQLKNWGYATGVRMGRIMHWTATDKEPLDLTRGEVPRQVTVKAWAPCTTRDWFVSASLWPAQVAA